MTSYEDPAKEKERIESLELSLTEEDILGCITYYLEDEVIAIRLLRHINRLEKRIEELEKV